MRFLVAGACDSCPIEPYMRRSSEAALAAAHAEAAAEGDLLMLPMHEDQLGGCSLKYVTWLALARATEGALGIDKDASPASDEEPDATAQIEQDAAQETKPLAGTAVVEARFWQVKASSPRHAVTSLGESQLFTRAKALALAPEAVPEQHIAAVSKRGTLSSLDVANGVS